MLLILCLRDEDRLLGITGSPDESNVVTWWPSSSESFILMDLRNFDAGSIYVRYL